MNFVGKALASVSNALGKAAMVFAGETGPRWWGWQRRFGRRPWHATEGYARNVDPQANSAVAACLLWIARTFPEAPIRVLDAEDEEVAGHPLTKLLRRPNPFYSGAALWMATAIDYNATGNAYWLKERDDLGRVTRLWYEPSWQIRPTWPADGSKFLGGYERMINGQTLLVRTADVVHFRFGIDPVTRLGVSPLASILSEVFTDDEAARFTASLLKNLGIPGVILAPKDPGAHVEDDVAEELKTKFEQRFGGDKRGSVMVMEDPTDVVVLSFSPQQMDLKELRRIPEERVCAVLGIPPGVAGLGAGLDRNCVPAYARVQTPGGPRTIAEIDAGAVVWSFKDGQIVPRMVEHKWANGTNTVYEIRTKNRRVRATDNHPFMVRVPGAPGRSPRYEWRDLRDLKVGDRIIQAKSYPDQGVATLPGGAPASVDLMQFLGVLMGDGTVLGAGQVHVAMPAADRCAAHYERLASELFTRQAKQSGGAVAIQEALPRAPITIYRGARYFGFRSAKAARELIALGVAGKARTKRVPSWIFALARPLRLAFLAGLVDSDGSIDKRGVLAFGFANRALTEDIRDLAISCGLQCSNIRRMVVRGSQLPNPGRQESYEAWSFVISSAQRVGEIPFSDPLYRERVEANPGRFKGDGFDAYKAGLSGDLGFYQVLEIIPIGEEEVFDLTVEDGHSFFCENVLVSNTFSNYAESREAAYEGNIIPTQRVFAAELDSQLLADLSGGDDSQQVNFDLGRVRVLQPDEDAKAKRFATLVAGTIMRVDEARKEFGLEVKPEHEVFLVAGRVSVVPAAELDKGVAPTGEQVTPAGGTAPPAPGVVPSSAPGTGGLPSSGNAPPQLMAVKAMVAPEGGDSALSPEEIDRLYELRLATVVGSNGNGHSG